MAQHPYQATVSTNQSIQQSLFPLWHDRRHSHSSDAILEEGERKTGSFDKLQDIVKEKQKEEDEEEEKEDDMEDVDFYSETPKIDITKATSDRVKSIVKDTTSYPPSIVIDNSELGETAPPAGIMTNDSDKKVRRSRSVKFNDDSQFIKTSN
ncbi:unnamed protein product [Mucor hiemalis]